jgi:hypothetical protein
MSSSRQPLGAREDNQLPPPPFQSSYSLIFLTVFSRGSLPTGQCIFMSSLPSAPRPSRQCLAPSWSSLYSKLTLYHGGGLAYSYYWRGFVGVKMKTSKGRLVLIPRCSIMRNSHLMGPLSCQEAEYTVTISTELNGRTVTQTVEKFPMGQQQNI